MRLQISGIFGIVWGCAVIFYWGVVTKPVHWIAVMVGSWMVLAGIYYMFRWYKTTGEDEHPGDELEDAESGNSDSDEE